MLDEERLSVAVWIAPNATRAQIEAYALSDSHDEDGPTNGFARDAGVWSIDPDAMDGNIVAKPLPIEKLVRKLAYAESFGAAVVAAGKRRRIEEATAVLAVYHHRYRGRWPSRSPMRFVGNFSYVPVSSRVTGRVRSLAPKREGSAPSRVYLEHPDPGERRFWLIERRKNEHIVHTGLIGLRGRETRRTYPDIATATRELDKAVRAKERAGWVRIEGSS
jgi:predicted DNA-binding WGR domain protein